ncbi:chorismate lyase [Fulvivirga maritima]|uniref:chorismate--pyruvate lyase family protein n=1 Tax=Fulvivirga maritima TaxID=2904247 RepID=UPI001F030576|nr:chorismate lyase [Fulvivirga maritima]UII27410.1 chorismate lyase [Fulvivirga maritima]
MKTTKIQNWVDVSELSNSDVPDNVYDWLTPAAYKLSDGIRRTYETFELVRISEGIGRLTEYEKQYLRGEYAYIRQIFLLGDEHPQVYARTVVPLKMYTAYKSLFDELGDKPIGENLLYNNPGITRSPFAISMFNMAHLPFMAYSPEGRFARRQEYILSLPIWNRQSVFKLLDLPFALITESFLPTIKKLKN